MSNFNIDDTPIYTLKQVENLKKSIIGSLAGEITKANNNNKIDDIKEAYENSIYIVNECWKNI